MPVTPRTTDPADALALALKQGCDADPQRGVEIASRSVRHPAWEVRLSALECLLEHGAPTYRRHAVEALEDAEESVVVTAIQCLVEWEETSASRKLLALLDSPSELVRSYSAWALGKLKLAEAVPLLVARFRPADAVVFTSAVAEALFYLTGDVHYEDYLLRQIHADDPETRAFTSESLIGIASARNVERLMEELRRAIRREKMPAIRERMTETLRRLSETSSGGGPVTFTCPVCGYDGLSEEPRPAIGGGSYEICPSCGFQFGVSDDDRGFTFDVWREKWIAGGMVWDGGRSAPPAGWDPGRQLARIGAHASHDRSHRE